MGAYENPALIQDRSGEIYGKSIAAFGQGIAAGLKTYTARVEARRKEALAEQKYRRQREDAINLAGIKATDAWAKGLRDNIPKDASALAFKSVEDFIAENSSAYLDAYKNRALATTAEERNKYQEEIQLFNNQAGMQTQAVANLTSGLDEIKQLAENGEGVFFQSKGEVGFKMLSTGLPIAGFENLDIKTSRNEQGETILNLSANVSDANQLIPYKLNPEDTENGKFSFDLNLNTFNPNSYVAKGFDVKDFTEAGVSTGFLNDDNTINKSAVIEITNAQGRTMQYYDATAFIESITPQIESQANSWNTGDVNDNAQAKATLMKMGYSETLIDNALEQGSQPASVENSVADLYRDFVLKKIKNTQVGIVDSTIIDNIRKYNQTVSESEQIAEPAEDSLYIYSGGDLQETTTTTTDGKQTEGQLERATAEYQLSKMMGTNLTDPEYFINYYKEAGSSEYGTPMRGSLAFETAINARKTNGELDPQYEDYRVILAQEGREAAEQKFKEDKGIGSDDILIVDKSGAIKNRVNVRNKKTMYETVLRSQGISAKNITTILTKFEKNAMDELREQYPDEDNKTLELIFKGQYW